MDKINGYNNIKLTQQITPADDARASEQNTNVLLIER